MRPTVGIVYMSVQELLMVNVQSIALFLLVQDNAGPLLFSESVIELKALSIVF